MDGDVEALADMRKGVTVEDALVAGHGQEQTARACDACARAVDEADGQHEVEECGGAAALGGLEEELSDRDTSRGGEEGIDVDKGEEGDDDEEQTTENMDG